MITLDASVLIAFLRRTDAHHEHAKAIMGMSSQRFAHTMTIAEVLAGPAAAGRLDEARGRLRQMDVTEAERVADEAAGLATIRAETRLRLPDCCVVLAAESSASALATFDARLASAARERGLAVVPQDPS